MNHAISPSPALRTGAPTPGTQVRALVAWAVAQRENTLRYAWNKVDAPLVRNLMGQLRVWLERNPHPSAATLKDWWAKEHATVRYVMPGTAAGRQRLQQLEQLIHAL